MNTHAIEPELLRPAPRAIKRRRVRFINSGCVQIFLLPHTIIGLGLLLWALHAVAVALFGVEVPAQITALDKRYGSKGSVSYRVKYTYSLGGRPHESRANLNQRAWSALQVGRPLQIRLLPLTPEHNTIPILPDNAGYKQALMSVPFALFWNGILSVFYIIMYGPIILSGRLVQNGIPVAAEIQDRQATTGKSHSYRIEYAYLPDTAGVAMPGDIANIKPFSATTASMQVSKDVYERLNKGDWTTALYDPKKPSRSILYLAAAHEAVQ